MWDVLREHAPQRSAQKHDIISRVDWSSEGGFVGIEVGEDMCENRGGFARRAELCWGFETGRIVSTANQH